MRHFGGTRRAGAVAEKPRHVARLRYGRARTVGDRAADPAAEDPVAFVRPFGRAVGHRGAARGVLQPGDSPRRLPAGVARRFGRPGAAGPHEPAAAGTGRSGVRGAGAPGLGGTRRAGVETPRVTVEGGAGAAQRHAVHGGLRRLGASGRAPSERLGRPYRGVVARCLRRPHRAVLRRGAPHPRPSGPARHGTRLPPPAGGQRTDRASETARAGPLFVPLHPAGARGDERHDRLCGERAGDGDQLADGQSDDLSRGGYGRLGGQFPRAADRPGDGFPGHRAGRAGQYLRAAHLQAHFGCAGTAEVPRGQSRAEQRLHDSAVHRRVDRQPVEGVVHACVGRFDSLVAGTGGPREHGLERRHETLPRGAEHRARAGHRTDERRAGLEFRRPARTSPELERMVADYRRRVPFVDNDCVMYPHIGASVEFLRAR